jgi:hypothetical protein
MNELLDPEDASGYRCAFLPPPAAVTITYDDEADVDDAACRYVLKRGVPPPGFGV